MHHILSCIHHNLECGTVLQKYLFTDFCSLLFIVSDIPPSVYFFLGMSEEPFNIWGTWHSTLKSGSKDPGMTGDVLSFKDHLLHLLFKLIFFNFCLTVILRTCQILPRKC